MTFTKLSHILQVTEIDTCKPMCTVVFENKNFKAENAVLDKFGGQPKNQSLKVIFIFYCKMSLAHIILI